MTIIDNIKDRLSAKSSKLGVIFHTWVAGLLFLCSVLGGLNDFVQTFPPELCPHWLKALIFFASVISFVGGKLTKEQPKQ